MDLDFGVPDTTLGVLNVPMTIVEGQRTLCTYTPTQSVTIFQAPPLHGDDGTSNARDNDQEHAIHDIQFNSIVWNTPTRKLVSQSYVFFMELHSLSKDKGVEPDDTVRYSRLYRSILHECVLGMMDMAQTAEQKGESEEDILLLRGQHAMYSALEVAWHLCEILFIETLPSGCLIQQLLEWVRWHNDSTDEMLRDLRRSLDPCIENHYWTTIYSLALQGRMDEIRELLCRHPFCRENKAAHKSIDELLHKVPMIRSVVGKSRTELRAAWHEWRQECQTRRDRGEFIGCPELNILCGILGGVEECFKNANVQDCCHEWYELMVGKLLYTSPLIISTDYELLYAIDSCLQLDVDDVKVIDKMIIAALKNNLWDVINLCCSSISNWWFVAHLSTVLYYRGALATTHLEYGSKLTEFLILEYANSLFQHPSYWEAAIDYCSTCTIQGSDYMATLVERVPLITDKKAFKVLRVCKKYGLTEQEKTIYKVLARRAYDRGLLGTSLSWCIRGKDSKFAAYVAEKYLSDYQDLGQFKDLDLLDHLGDAMLLSSKLTFLGKYRQMHLKYKKGDFVGAGELLVTLLGSGIVPKKYWITLLTDALPLLELTDQLVFNVANTQSLIHFTQQLKYYYKDDHASGDNKAIESQEVTGQKMALLRLSLMKNLSRAILHSNSKDS